MNATNMNEIWHERYTVKVYL